MTLPSDPLCGPVPFWFAHEEPAHVQAVLDCYTRFLQLNTCKDKSSRLPDDFIGGVHRTVPPLHIEGVRVLDHLQGHLGPMLAGLQPTFITFDEVSVYLNEVYEFDHIPCGEKVRFLAVYRSPASPFRAAH